MENMFTEFAVYSGTVVLGALPRGKGATILILGGILVVFLAFLMTLAASRLHPVAIGGAPRRRRPDPAAALMPVVVRPQTESLDDPRLGWSGPVIRAAADAGVRGMTVLAVERDRVVVRLDACRSCHRQASRRPRCEPERRLFVRLARAAGLSIHVEELLCERRGQGACVFELDRGVLR